MSGPSRSPVEGQVKSTSQQDQQQSQANEGTAQSSLNQFEGPVQSSPFYKSLLSAGTQGTANAYASAKANTAASANRAGFGENQPIAQGAQNQVNAQEAAAQSAVPQTALVQATQPELAATAQTAGIGESQGSQAVSYSGQEVNLEEQYQQLQEQQQQALYNALGTAAAGIGV